MRDDGLQVLEYADSKGTVDGREVVEELGQGPVVLQVVQQRADGHACSDEHGRTAQKLGIGVYAWDWLVHGASRRADDSSIRPLRIRGVANQYSAANHGKNTVMSVSPSRLTEPGLSCCRRNARRT